MMQLPKGKPMIYGIVVDKNNMVRFDNLNVVPRIMRKTLQFDKHEPKGRQYYIPLTTYRKYENGTNTDNG